jgi:GNAT superfamily N-acetyltransferase
MRRIRHDEFDPSEPQMEDGPTEKDMMKEGPFWYSRRFWVRKGPEAIGYARVEGPKPESPEYESGKHVLWFGGGVITPARRQGIGRALLGRVLDVADEVGATVVSTYTEEEDGVAVLEHLGAEVKQLERRARLDLTRVDWSEIRKWVEELDERSPTTRLELYPDRLPDEFLPEYTAARTVLMNLMPWDDMDHGEIVVTPQDFDEMYERLAFAKTEHHTLIAREADGMISGITDIAWRPSAPDRVAQWFTGVHPDTRGRGVGKALKARMLEYIHERYPGATWMSTENSTTNGAMLAINNRLGFREHRVGRTYQIGRDRLAEYLGR